MTATNIRRYDSNHLLVSVNQTGSNVAALCQPMALKCLAQSFRLGASLTQPRLKWISHPVTYAADPISVMLDTKD